MITKIDGEHRGVLEEKWGLVMELSFPVLIFLNVSNDHKSKVREKSKQCENDLIS